MWVDKKLFTLVWCSCRSGSSILVLQPMSFVRNSLIFLVVSGIYLLVLLLIPGVEYWIKPMLMPALLLFYFLQAEIVDKFLVRALVACWAGDVLLMLEKQSPIYFLLGLVVFLIGHVMFILTMRRLIRPDVQHGRPELTLLVMTAVLAAAAGVWLLIREKAGDLLLAVSIYEIVIASMFFHALRRRSRTSRDSFLLMVFGALSFMISDSLLALNRWYFDDLQYAGFFVMTTYLLAQYLLVSGVLKHREAPVS